ncbi:MAG: hypothetical protein EP349_08555 [Alphaproteobacteria bacterium]|nr:MAG: hypothetical protein EP349_08555 [Alphaproteobacteria bacterium]
MCLFCAAPQAVAVPPDISALENDIAAAAREIGATEKELSSLKRQQAKLKKQAVPKNKKNASAPDTGALSENIADYTRNLAVLQQQLDAAFLALSDAPARQSISTENSALLGDPDLVVAAAREEWLAHAVAQNALAAIRAESGNLDETRQKRQQLEKTHRKQAHAAEEHRQRLNNLAHQITVTQKLLSEQRQALATQREKLAQEKQQLAAQKAVRKPMAKPVTVAAAPQNALLKPVALTAPAVQQVAPGRFPVNGKVVMKFGDKDALGVKSSGIVLEAAEGENIVLPQEGVIKFAGAFGKFKQLLIVEHKGGYHSLISGLDQVETKIGERLPAGAVIGHLAQAQAYYELRHNGVPVDPDKVSMPF